MTLTINGQTVQVPAGTTILEAAEKAGIKIPTLCYLKDINKIAACRMCVVEVEGSDRLAAACDTVAEICGATVTLHKGTLPLLLEQPAGAAVRELVIAGAGQGALDYVQRTYGVGPEALHHCRDDAPPDFSARYICGLEHYVRYCLETGQTPRLGFDPAAVLVCGDLFCGVVPVDPALRAWREATGHYLARLSSQAARVTRVFAGLPQRLK